MASLTKCRAPGAAALVNAELSVLLTDNRGIRKINRMWRKKDAATDVLSFPLYSISQLRFQAKKLKKGDNTSWPMGDVIISLERAAEQARDKKVKFHDEIRWLLVHGILHLMGYDHEISPREERRMRRLERSLLTR